MGNVVLLRRPRPPMSDDRLEEIRNRSHGHCSEDDPCLSCELLAEIEHLNEVLDQLNDARVRNIISGIEGAEATRAKGREEGIEEAAEALASWDYWKHAKAVRGLLDKPGETEATQDVEYSRAGHQCICDNCGKQYIDHPRDMENLGYDDRPFLYVLCNGKRVKL